MSEVARKTVFVHPEAGLGPHAGDRVLNSALLGKIEEIRKLKKGISAEKYPGAIVLRRYRAGEVVCRQGEAGNTAFYVLTSADVESLNAPLPEDEEAAGDAQSGTSPGQPAAKKQRIGTVLIFTPKLDARPVKLWERLLGRKPPKSPVPPELIPNDGSVDISYRTRDAELLEGDVFGEMSCMTYAPRSATVRIDRDCYLLEFNRNIFELMRNDKSYKDYIDKIYIERALDGQLRRLELFSDLNDKQFAELRKGVSFKRCKPGEVICEEGDTYGDTPPDVFLIRSGVVQVVQNAVISLKADEISDWKDFCKALVAAGLSIPKTESAAAGALIATGEGDPASVGATPAAAAKQPSPLELHAAKKAAAAQAAAANPAPAADGESPPPGPAASGKPLSPLEIHAQRKAAKAAAEANAGPPVVEKPATPERKQSPLELHAARKAAAAKAETEESAAATAVGGAAAPPATSERKLSPLELHAARKAEAAKAQAQGATPDSDVESPAPSGRKLSPLEMHAARKKTAEARTDGAGATATAGTEARAPTGGLAEKQLLRTKITMQVFSPQQTVWAWLSDDVHAAIRRIADSPALSARKTSTPPETQESSKVEGAELQVAEAKSVVMDAFNELLRSRSFLSTSTLAATLEQPPIRQRVQLCPKGLAGIEKDWSDVDLRVVGRTLLSLIFPEHVRLPVETQGPPRVLAYRSRGDVIGEMALVLNQPRSATCIAYDHPPDPTGKRKPVEVELVRIRGDVLLKLMQDDKSLSDRVHKIAHERTATLSPTTTATLQAPLGSEAFQQLGLYQGQRLLVIDLDTCTRCGDCMRACVSTHDDGQSRLFLDGPRFDRFLIPSACRQCLDPKCMTRCPVGSIQRGDNLQIEIKDWCIGCRNCAEECPYDSIQMHDIGIVQEQRDDCEFAPLSVVGERWRGSFGTRQGWSTGLAPFAWTMEFRNLLATAEPGKLKTSGSTKRWSKSQGDLPEPICFRLRFKISPAQLNESSRFELKLTTPQWPISIWVNGAAVELGTYKKGRKGDPDAYVVELQRSHLRKQENSLEVMLEPPGNPVPFLPEHGTRIFGARLDPCPEVGDLTRQTLPEGAGESADVEVALSPMRAVVCDLCSHLSDKEPACVAQCPHDAALRLNPLTEFDRIWNR